MKIVKCRICEVEKYEYDCVRGKNLCRTCSSTYQKNRRRLLSINTPKELKRTRKPTDEVLKDFIPMKFKTTPTAVISYDEGCWEEAMDVLRVFTTKERQKMGLKINGNNIEIY